MILQTVYMYLVIKFVSTFKTASILYVKNIVLAKDKNKLVWFQVHAFVMLDIV
jgi:hypothetical protein